MNNSSNDLSDDSIQHHSQKQQSSAEVAEYNSEIEKLYHKIKEDWL